MAADSSISPDLPVIPVPSAESPAATSWHQLRTAVWIATRDGEVLGRVEHLANGWFAIAEPNLALGLFECEAAAREAVLRAPRLAPPPEAATRSAESYEQLATRLATEHPTLTLGHIETILTEEHELLIGIDPADIVPPIVVEATLERVESFEARRHSDVG
ncbi:hypothetical protein [Schumannella soli]|uniref:Uncharacterized protein n=1 Tax=Schumannella soli TaxID=2590779 RepID=A0A506Y4L9_9MICO|nr:hypothetical protein [Schumannella soli]TPW76357.1 hypothetical protein FJ657_11305 [Schumannella soli]